MTRQRRLRVLWCIRCLGFGGAERLLASCAAVRDREQFDYEAAYVLPSYRAMVPELEAEGIPVHCLGLSDHNFDLRWVPRLRRLLSERDYDIVHFHLPYTAGIGRVVARSMPSAKRPATITTEHNAWSTNHLLVRWANSLTMPLDAAVIAVDRGVRDALPTRHRAATETVVHGVPVERLRLHAAGRSATRAELGVTAGEVLVGTVANLRPGKGYEILLPAARQLLDRGLPVQFAAVGVGPLKDEISRLHGELQLGDRFRLLGGRRDAARFVAAFDIFVLPSRFEGLPVSVMEALALGVPVVASDVGGIPELVTDGVEGSLVPPGSQDQLVEALASLISDPQARLRMASAARRRGSSLDITAAVRRVEAIYREVLSMAPADGPDDTVA